MNVTKVELGCGRMKRPGFFGIDILPAPEVDLVLDYEVQQLPFPDGSVEHIYSSHSFEHLGSPASPIAILREIVRVAQHGATVEIWTPYGRSNEALLIGHRTCFTELHWEHICSIYDDFYLGDAPGRFVWERTQYRLAPGILGELARLQIPLPFALEHMSNIAQEFGIFLRVDKNARQAQRPQHPQREFCYQRGELLDVSQAPPAPSEAVAALPDRKMQEPPLRHRLVDTLNASLKSGVPGLHTALKKTLGRWRG
jgi:hypothetical protein